MLFSNRVSVRVTVRIRFGVWLVTGYAHVFIQLYVVVDALLFYVDSVKFPHANARIYLHKLANGVESIIASFHSALRRCVDARIQSCYNFPLH